MNIEVHVAFQIIVLSRYMSRREITRFYGNSSFWKNLQTVFHGGSPIYTPTNSKELLFFSHPLQHLVIVELCFLGLFVCLFVFLGPLSEHVEILRLGVKSEL